MTGAAGAPAARQAELRHGVLSVRLPKREDAKPRSIQVKLASNDNKVLDQGEAEAA